MISIIGKKYALSAEQIGDGLCASFFFNFTLSTIQRFIMGLRMNTKGAKEHRTARSPPCVRCKAV